MSSGRFDEQFLCEETERDDDETSKAGQSSTCKAADDTLWVHRSSRSDLITQEYGDIVRIPVDSDWAGSEERYFTHAGLEIHGGHLVDSWVASGQVRALSSGEAELHAIVDGSARGIFTKHMYEEIGRTINIDVEMDSTAAIGMRSRTGVGKTRHVEVRWLWIHDATRDKVVRLRR